MSNDQASFAGTGPSIAARFVPLALVGLPTVFLLAFFVFPTAYLLSASFLASDGMELTGGLTLDNYLADLNSGQGWYRPSHPWRRFTSVGPGALARHRRRRWSSPPHIPDATIPKT